LHREHTLVKEARATLREEIEHNATSLTGALKTIAEERASIKNDIDALTKIQERLQDKTLQNPDLNASYSIQSLHEAAWKTAQATGALAYMPYAESQRYTGLYESQQAFLAYQDKTLEDEAQFLGVIAKVNFSNGNITPEKASAALGPLGI